MLDTSNYQCLNQIVISQFTCWVTFSEEMKTINDSWFIWQPHCSLIFLFDFSIDVSCIFMNLVDMNMNMNLSCAFIVIIQKLQEEGTSVALRSCGDNLTHEISIYVVDSLGFVHNFLIYVYFIYWCCVRNKQKYLHCPFWKSSSDFSAEIDLSISI